MSTDRILAKTLKASHRLTEALLGHDPASSDDDSPLANLRSLLRQKPGTADVVRRLYKAEPGPYPVDTHQQVFRHQGLGREVAFTALYPLGLPGPEGFPVVVVSPGLGAHAQATRYVETHLASHGYLVLSPIHSGSDWTAVFRRTPFGAFSRKELHVRVAEVILALELLEKKRLPLHLCRRANPDKAAVVGHSFGALTLQAIAGVPVADVGGQAVALSDPRFKAFIAMSPYGDSFPAQRLGMTAEGYAQIERPILFMSGDRDDLWTVGRGPHAHLRPFEWVKSPDRYHLLIGGTKHSDFSQVMGLIKRRTATMVNSTATAFLDCYLKGDEEARRYLSEDWQVAAAHFQSWAFLPTTSSGA